MAKILCVLYDDPIDGMPTVYPRDDLPKIDRYPDGQTLPTPRAIDFTPGELLGCVSGELGLAQISRKPGPHVRRHVRQGWARQRIRARTGRCRCRHLAAVLAGLSDHRTHREGEEPQARVTAGIGSDHADLQAAIERGITVAEVTYCNSISVAEHVVMMILSLVRNYLPSQDVVRRGGWDIADCAARSYDVEGMHVGTVAAGRIGARCCAA